ncbi:Hypothetical_protein [Hexamita inflata]|uniref:Hypothetical_protein n=1 Tax=Hexamita inflata TaxID=28002 RepID=A0AA86NUX5_9EUKA|nr:Hypothetical protein HINF_LOCUS14290 [Hexamita inflata]
MNKKKRQQLYAHTERIPFEINQFSSQQLFNIETQWKTIEDKYLVNHHLQSQIIPPTLKPAKKIIKQQDVSQCCGDNKIANGIQCDSIKIQTYQNTSQYFLKQLKINKLNPSPQHIIMSAKHIQLPENVSNKMTKSLSYWHKIPGGSIPKSGIPKKTQKVEDIAFNEKFRTVDYNQ